MSKVFKDHEKYVRECAERAKLAREGKINTSAIGRDLLVKEWDREIGLPPVVPNQQEKE